MQADGASQAAGVLRADGALLAALQLGDSLFPSGGFTLSHGLETLAERRLVTDAASLQTWIANTVRWQIGTTDAVATAAAWAAADDLDLDLDLVAQIDRRLLATKLARESRQASERTGRQTLSTLAGLAGGRLADLRRLVLNRTTPGLYPVVLGVAGRQLGMEQRATVLLLLHLHVAGCLGAALRLIDVDDVEAQQIRFRLAPLLAAVADEALTIPWKEMYGCAVQTELMTMMHETAITRLFAS
ncbi:MAG: urease accessory protein [Chloroflexi bacterium]|nr:urease accessory protein [Chloroflexota bacterium]